MRLGIILGLVLALPALATAQDARSTAQAFLTRGSALFDARDAAGLAATYVEDAKVELLVKDNDAGTWKVIVKEGRAEIERTYKEDLFEKAEGPTTSRNEVEYAREVAPGMMIVVGTFEPDITKGRKFPFVQERRKVGERWLIATLRIYAAD